MAVISESHNASTTHNKPYLLIYPHYAYYFFIWFGHDPFMTLLSQFDAHFLWSS